jgi:Legume lectin domain/IPTL-CTERM motif
MKTATLAGWVLSLVIGFAAQSHAATLFNFPNFNDCTGLQINGNAACTGGVLRLTPALGGQGGSTFSATTIALGSGAAFSTFFSFRMTAAGGAGDSDGPGADGLTFTVQPNSATVGGSGGGMGYAGIPNSVAAEFDTFDNGIGSGDPNGNHVGIDLNGSINSVVTGIVPTRFNNGQVWFVWIDYNGSVIEARVSPTNSRPASPNVALAVNLPAVLGTSQAFVGFTAGTGAGFENHDILSWQFDNAFAPIGAVSAIPTLSETALFLVALLLGAAGLGFIRWRRTLPHRTSNNNPRSR